MRFVVTSTNPSGIVIITEETEIVMTKTVPASLKSIAGHATYDDVGGYHDIIKRLRLLVEIPVRNPELLQQVKMPYPKGILITGPPGTGKSLIAEAVANEAGAHVINLTLSEVASSVHGDAEKRLRRIFREAIVNAPSVIIVDDIEILAPKRDLITVTEMSRRVTTEFLRQFDQISPSDIVFVIATTTDANLLEEGFRRSGRFDVEISLFPPRKDEREEIFLIKTRGIPLHPDVNFKELADRTSGYTGADVTMVIKEAIFSSLKRLYTKMDIRKKIPPKLLRNLTIQHQDFNEALKKVQPSAMRTIRLDIPEVTWDDIGGLEEVKQELIETIEWPLTHPQVFKEMGITPPNGVLLFGPPGTGKTLIAKAIANSAGYQFIPIRGPELTSKWFGETERAIREVFRRARQAAPSIIFFDEIDSMLRARGTNAGEPWMDRIINQLLAEMDGIDRKTQVVIIGATNRPELLDPAALRPGRLDRHVYVPSPDLEARVQIFKVHTRQMPLGEDVDLKELAEKTHHYVGADIENVCREAALLALRENLSNRVVMRKHFLKALERTSPSMNEELERHYLTMKRHLRGSLSQPEDQRKKSLEHHFV